MEAPQGDMSDSLSISQATVWSVADPFNFKARVCSSPSPPAEGVGSRGLIDFLIWGMVSTDLIDFVSLSLPVQRPQGSRCPQVLGTPLRSPEDTPALSPPAFEAAATHEHQTPLEVLFP